MKTGFVRALTGSCSGIAIFEQLRSQHIVRTIFHLILMTMICSAIMGIGIHKDWKKKSHTSINTIVDNCGSIKISKNGFIPSKNPDQIQTFIVAGPFALTYLPEKSTLPADFQQGCNQGVIWSGSKLLVWQKNSDKFILTPVNNEKTIDNEYVSSAKEIEEVLYSLRGININSEFSLTAAGMNVISNILLVIVQCVMFLVNFLQVAFYIAIFAGIFALMNMGRPHRFPVNEMIKLAVYAGFPPMLIGSAATLLELPLLDFNLTYILGMTFYLMYIMNHLDRMRQEQEWQDKEQP